ncbi:MAG: hypothetical protein APG12_00551 [Candidatus Methanofastidiosum methylothiophilum]|uniref:Histidine kinase N-terminal 7TM region domain-containing protein n=1 Tax=Candidatus Methanofastidiosum methylothiophilum TaxID=1705564 RepID=A0A150ITT2_9EURY|nr:MAG: hypothetical protein APG10_00492 [Candidatus Methanofastidiosum methylthiophilus]KYC48386.1 MAG: hypothetical protein APG11_00399 [Candidatus Methanofastidiosum methylthiophilus]KYC50749.1 MAG: hypothetical protein APG12_00551 [Candidatus Methanofastidiosum methylthiophilus]
MGLESLGFHYSILSSILSSFLIIYSLFIREKDYNKAEELFIFGVIFIGISWSGIEWSLYLMGYNLFLLITMPIFPLLCYFISTSAFVIYLSERYYRRRIWIIFAIAAFLISIIAVNCMNCLFE